MGLKTGFQKLALRGDILFAANGPNIHSFRASGEFPHLSSWKYPQPWLSPKESSAKVDTPAEDSGVEVATTATTEPPVTKDEEAQAVEEDGPPSKRRRVENEPAPAAVSRNGEPESVATGGGEVAAAQDQPMPDRPEEAPEAKEGKGKGKGKKQKAKGNGKDYGLGFGKQKAIIDIPMFQCMTTTTDGKYLVGVIGSTKTIWTFEHDGQGRLTELSQRPMPKRPCSIVITADNKTLLSADKFGDVYALPVDPREGGLKEDTPAPASRTSSAPGTPVPFKYQANPLTVHTKRNLMALENQRRQAEQQVGLTERKPAPQQQDFEHALVLGHVSMLTDLVLASRAGREYILTADRDEHIRVSRGLPQAHVVERYCLGHREFVSVLHLPAARPDLLISGGGDDHLHVWDWFRGELVQKIPVGPPPPAAGPGKGPVAVSGIASFGRADDGSTDVMVVCEGSSKAYSYRLTADRLEFTASHDLSGNVLDVVGIETGPCIVSLDPGLGNFAEPEAAASGSGNFFRVVGGASAASASPVFSQAEDLADDLPEGLYENLKKAMYTIEPLRKTGYERKDGSGGEETSEGVVEGEEGSEAVEGQE